jgi:hypothetical protein
LTFWLPFVLETITSAMGMLSKWVLFYCSVVQALWLPSLIMREVQYLVCNEQLAFYINCVTLHKVSSNFPLRLGRRDILLGF